MKKNDAIYTYFGQWLEKTFKTEVQSKATGNGKEARFDKIFTIHPYLSDKGKPRQWRADFWIPKHKIVIEIHGGEWAQGRHVRGNGFADDLRKANTAAANGAMYFAFTYTQLFNKEYVKLLTPLAIGLNAEFLQRKKLVEDYEKIVNSITNLFLKTHDLELEYWVADRVGGIAEIAGMFLNFDDILTAVRLNLDFETVYDWYWFNVEIEKFVINLETYGRRIKDYQTTEALHGKLLNEFNGK